MRRAGKTGTAHAAARLGIDVGGTFTDFVLADPRTGSYRFHKEPSTPDDPSRAVAAGVAALTATAPGGAATIGLVVHGTTLGLNAILQRRGAPVALVVSLGNRDVMEIARARLPSSYDVTAGREPPLVPRRLVFEVSARIAADGSVVARPDAAELDALAALIRASDAGAVAVMLLNSYRDGTLEAAVSAGLQERLPDLAVTPSAAVWPAMREYERALIACLNAHIQPLMAAYLRRLERRLAALGLTAPIHVTANNGGALGLATARARPIETVLSGPASGVIAAARLAAAGGESRLLTFDMGGTSTDIAVSAAGVPEFTTATRVGDYPLMLPVVNVSAIGAGGGSIVWIDPQGVLKIGPESAGAAPGPVCYGAGGTRPTITDAYLLTGMIAADRFLGGTMRLDRDAAAAAFEILTTGAGGQDHADGAVSKPALGAATAAIRVATAMMATEVTKTFARRGLDPRPFCLVAYGGAGPTQANLLAEEVGLDGVLVPAAAGTFCAFGAVLADLRRDYVRAVRVAITPQTDAAPEIERAFAALRVQAAGWATVEGAVAGDTTLIPSLDMRYPAQAHDLTIPLPAPSLVDGAATVDPAALARLFHDEHERLYGFREDTSAVEVTHVRLAVVGRLPAVPLPSLPAQPAPTPRERRPLHLAGGTVVAMVFERADLGAGATIVGPAVVEQRDSTVVVLPGWALRADAAGNLHIRRAETSSQPSGVTSQR